MIHGLRIEHLSYSSIAMWKRCPREWWLRYKYNITSAPTPALPFGTAMHRSVQGAIISGGVTDATSAEFEKQLKQAATEIKLRMMPSEITEHATIGRAILDDLGIRAVLNSIRVSSKEQIEVKVEFNVPGVDVPVVGYIDIIDDEGHPYDIKTSKYDWDDERAANELQPAFYLTALDLLGDTRHGGKFTHVVITKSATSPSAYMVDSTRTDYMSTVFTTVQEMWDEVKHARWEERTVRDACTFCKLKAPCYYNK